MRIVIAAEELKKALDVVMPAIPSKATIPILNHVHLDASDELTLTGQDSEIGIRHKIPCQMETPGAVTIPARLLSDAVTGLSGDVSIEMGEGGRIILKGGGATMRLSAIDATEYPSLPVVSAPCVSVVMDGSAFAESTRKVRFAVADDKTRPCYCGVLLQPDEPAESGYNLVATDGHMRCAFEPFAAPAGLPEIIIPSEAVDIISRLFDGTMVFTTNGNLIDVRSETSDTVFVSRLIAGPFANWRRIIPNFETELDIPRAPFLSALKQAMVVAKNEEHKKTVIRIKERAMTVSSSGALAGDASIRLDVDSDAEMEFAVSLPDLQNAVGVSDAVNLRLKFSSTLSPIGIDGGYVQSPMFIS